VGNLLREGEEKRQTYAKPEEPVVKRRRILSLGPVKLGLVSMTRILISPKRNVSLTHGEGGPN